MNDTATTTTTAPNDKKKKRLKRILYALAAIFLILLIALIYYLLMQRPITRVLPGAPAAAPRFVKTIYGGFGSLSDIDANANGSRIYAVDSENNKIWTLNADGKVLFSFGKAVDKQFPLDGFLTPLFAAVAPNGNVYVTDRERAKISIYSPLGKFIGFFTPTGTEETEWSPLAIDIDTNGDVYITDAKKGENRVMVFDKKGKFKRKFGKSGRAKGQFTYPNGISVTDNRIYVTDTSSARVQAFDKKGKFLFLFRPGTGTELTHPVGIDASRAGEVLVVESFGHEVQSYDRDGGELYKFGAMGIMDRQFQYPTGIAVTPGGSVYIADRSNKRIQIWKY